MKLLALDTATEVMAVALADGDASWHLNAPGGALASAHLIPTLMAQLAAQGLVPADLDAVAFGQGPGAFTGLRTAVSVAQGLAFGSGRPVLAIDSLLIVADDARAQAQAGMAPSTGADAVIWVAMDARMDEIYAGAYAYDGQDWQVRRPAALYDLPGLQAVWALEPPTAVAGSALAAFGSRLSLCGASRWPQEQDRAAALLRLARAAWRRGAQMPAEQALPLYLRDKVALTTAERLALKPTVAPAGASPDPLGRP
jgi:tRNA threonylcarbamoyladenosine biosynthesis protein TsaB